MTLIWQIVRKDARRLWLLLAVWIVLILVQHGAEWRLHGLAPEFPPGRRVLESLIVLCFVIRLLVAYLLAAGLVLEDPAGGTTAFWMTRPISGGRMLTAKLAGSAVLLLGPPLVLGLPWWAAGIVAVTPLQVLGWHAAIVLAGLVVATLSSSVTQFALWTVAAQIALMPVLSLLLNPVGQSATRARAAMAAAPGRLALVGVVFAIGVGVAVVARYQRRSHRRVLGALALATAALIAMGWTVLR